MYARRYETCSVDQVLSKLAHRAAEFEFEPPATPCRSSPPKFTENFQERVNNFMQMIYSVSAFPNAVYAVSPSEKCVLVCVFTVQLYLIFRLDWMHVLMQMTAAFH